MLHTTFALLRQADACTEGYRKAHKALHPRYGEGPIPLTAILESNGCADALWCLRAILPKEVGLRDRLARLLACDYAEHVAHLWVAPPGVTWQPADTITVARRYAWGLATKEELLAAWIAAWDAAWITAWDAARDTAWIAARDAARATVWTAAWAAAWTAAWDAARDAAETQWQANRFLAVLDALTLEARP